jgi:hypothetical protein
MTALPRKRHLGAEERRALQLLARSPFGTTEAIMLAHGFKRRPLAGLVRAGLAAPRNEVVTLGQGSAAAEALSSCKGCTVRSPAVW